mmetsp:Transcript_32855/g.101799  ORF Transcript_32855/g.101799 Transcript_32855/m.101799 type:complete len:264 (-) Transcript_32855:549-1340(-)
MMVMRNNSSAMQIRGRAAFWYCSAFSISTTPFRVCSATCSMLKSMRSRMVPWSITSTASSLKMDESSWIDSAILRISASRSSTSCSTSTTADSCWSVNSVSPASGGRSPPPDKKSKPPPAPSFWDFSLAKYSFCARRKSVLRPWIFTATLRCTLARIFRSLSSGSLPSADMVATRLRVCSHARKSLVASRVLPSIARSSLASSPSSNETMSRRVWRSFRSRSDRSISSTSPSTFSTTSTQTGGRLGASAGRDGRPSPSEPSVE